MAVYSLVHIAVPPDLYYTADHSLNRRFFCEKIEILRSLT